jgi:hypothetical protein
MGRTRRKQPQIRGRRQIQNPISISDMRDAVVDEGTYSKYVNEIIPFIDWLHANAELSDWLTQYCAEQHAEIILLRENEGMKQRQKRIKTSWTNLLKNAGSQPLLHLDRMTPTGVMTYIRLQANQKTGKYLSASSYNGKRAAIRHLVRVHWGQNNTWSEDFNTQLEILWRGFTRHAMKEKTTTARKRRAKRKHGEIEEHIVDETDDRDNAGRGDEDNGDGDDDDDDDDVLSEDEEDDMSENEEDDDDDDRDENQVGKTGMTPELYKCCCRWFLEWGTTEGIFCACFFAFTWHLACRSNNTARIRYGHMSWTVFDAMHVRFRHTKTQQHGEARRQKRACYSNPFEWYIDLPLLMGLYFATNFNSNQRRGLKLFPGGAKAQSARVMNLFKKLLIEHEDEVLAMGYNNIDELGLHSLRKGVSSFLASLPGGPPPAAICLRGGWSMGPVKDIYYHQTQVGDEFVGRCAAMLNMFNGDFATSPAFFECDDIEMRALADEAVKDNFPHHHGMDGMKRVLHRCLAAMIFHRETILQLPPNHVARSILMFCQSSPSVHTNVLADHVNIIHSWETNTELSGIPPHMKTLVDIVAIRESQDKMVDRVFNKVVAGVKDLLDTRKITGGELTESRLKDMIKTATAPDFQVLNVRFDQLLDRRHPLQPPRPFESMESDDSRQPVDELRLNGGLLSRLPANYEFPQAGVYDLWIKWNVRDTVRKIPPLKTLHSKDYSFLDSKPSPKPGGGKRRAARKIFSDMKYICGLIETAAKEIGMDPSDGVPANIRLIYEQVSPSVFAGVKLGGRNTQFHWATIVDKVRRRKKREKEAEAIGAGVEG